MELATQAKRYISSTLTMADCCVLTRSKRLLSNSVQKLNLRMISNKLIVLILTTTVNVSNGRQVGKD